MRERRSLWKKAIVLCVFAAAVIIGTGHLTEARAYETAYYPAPQVYLTQLAYESYSHGSCNAIDMAPGGDVFAPFTGKILQKDARWGYVLFQSTDKVYYADGTLDYMTVGFMHDSDISNLYVGQTISQGTKFYQAGGMGNGVPNAYGPHVDLSVFKGKVNSVTQYGRGNYFAYKAFYVYTAKTKIVYPGVVESGNRVNNGAPSNYSGLWKTISQPISSSPDITISGANAPGTISAGNVFSITGTVNSGMPLTNVTAGVYDYSGAMKTGKSAAPNAASYNIKDLDNYVYFNHLPAGRYVYKVTASNASKSATLVQKAFFVLGKSRVVADGLYMFNFSNNENCGITVEGNSQESGRALQLWKNDIHNNHMKWRINYVDNGYYRITNAASGMVMDVRGGGSQIGTKIQQYISVNSAAQLWQIVPAGPYYCFVPQCATSSCLDSYEGKTVDGNVLQLCTVNTSSAQLWKLTSTMIESGTMDAPAGAWSSSSVALGESATLTWNKVNRATKYILDGWHNGKEIVWLDVTNADSYTFTADEVGTYRFFVIAVNGDEKATSKSIELTVTAYKEVKDPTGTGGGTGNGGKNNAGTGGNAGNVAADGTNITGSSGAGTAENSRKETQQATVSASRSKQPMKVSPGTKKFSAAKLKKKGRTFKISVKKAKGKVTYKSSNKKYVKVTSKGKVTVKKKTPKGTYKITVRARGNKKYKSGSRTIKIKVK